MSEIKIVEISDRREALIEKLVQVWESSVRDTHLFLSEDAISEIKSIIPQALLEVTHLIVSVNNIGEPVGFMGVDDRRIEMLFISPDVRGKGIGKALVQYGIKRFAIHRVTVNEQNPQALRFYEHIGFRVYKRSETDEQGREYPILYMEL